MCDAAETTKINIVPYEFIYLFRTKRQFNWLINDQGRCYCGVQAKRAEKKLILGHVVNIFLRFTLKSYPLS